MMKSLLLAPIVALGLSATAATAATYTYDLMDNANGGLTTNGAGYNYGLRLDGHKDHDSDPYFILSFKDNGATLTYDDQNGIVQITGTMTRSLAGNQFGDTWEVFYQMAGVTDTGDGTFIDTAGNGFGVVRNGDTEYALGAKSRPSDGAFFYLRDASDSGRPDGSGNRVGEGWVNTASIWKSTNDFLFTAGEYDYDPDGQLNPVPLPAAAWMLLAAVGGLGAMSRRNKRA